MMFQVRLPIDMGGRKPSIKNLKFTSKSSLHSTVIGLSYSEKNFWQHFRYMFCERLALKIAQETRSIKTPSSQAHWQARVAPFFSLTFLLFCFWNVFFVGAQKSASCGLTVTQTSSRLHKRIETNVARRFFNRLSQVVTYFTNGGHQ